MKNLLILIASLASMLLVAITSESVVMRILAKIGIAITLTLCVMAWITTGPPI
ncbi:MAG: hypothetical protein IJN85_00735 [Oscillospiraceae bacterium]|nr:hypothetical protein [Oscillospiraceae bacterium]